MLTKKVEKSLKTFSLSRELKDQTSVFAKLLHLQSHAHCSLQHFTVSDWDYADVVFPQFQAAIAFHSCLNRYENQLDLLTVCVIHTSVNLKPAFIFLSTWPQCCMVNPSLSAYYLFMGQPHHTVFISGKGLPSCHGDGSVDMQAQKLLRISSIAC